MLWPTVRVITRVWTSSLTSRLRDNGAKSRNLIKDSHNFSLTWTVNDLVSLSPPFSLFLIFSQMPRWKCLWPRSYFPSFVSLMPSPHYSTPLLLEILISLDDEPSRHENHLISRWTSALSSYTCRLRILIYTKISFTSHIRKCHLYFVPLTWLMNFNLLSYNNKTRN